MERRVWPLPSRAACLGAGLTCEQCALQVGWTQTQSAELSLIVVELSTNAVRHGKAGVCTMVLTLDECGLEVRDEGSGFPAWVLKSLETNALIEAARPGPKRSRGLGAGLDVVRRLATKLWLSNNPVTGGAYALARVLRRSA